MRLRTKSCTKRSESKKAKKQRSAPALSLLIQLETVDAHAPGHVRTIVSLRREHQARTHVRTSEESTKRTCAHPAAGITSTELGGLARPRKAICKRNRFVNDLERTTDSRISFAYGMRSLRLRVASHWQQQLWTRITARCAR